MSTNPIWMLNGIVCPHQNSLQKQLIVNEKTEMQKDDNAKNMEYTLSTEERGQKLVLGQLPVCRFFLHKQKK